MKKFLLPIICLSITSSVFASDTAPEQLIPTPKRSALEVFKSNLSPLKIPVDIKNIPSGASCRLVRKTRTNSAERRPSAVEIQAPGVCRRLFPSKTITKPTVEPKKRSGDVLKTDPKQTSAFAAYKK